MATARLGVVVAACVGALSAPALASAEPCANLATGTTALTDPLGFMWDNLSTGQVDDGGGADGYDAANRPIVTVGATTLAYLAPDPNACVREDGGREIVFPEQNIGGLMVSRKLYVPATGTSFARWLNILRNPDPANPVTASVAMELGNLGSDQATKVVATSSGDQIMGLADGWAVTDDSRLGQLGARFGDPALIHVWQSTEPGVDTADVMPEAFEVNDDVASVVFQNVTVPAAGTAIIMSVGAQRQTSLQASDGTAAMLARGTTEVFAGLSDAEEAQIVNWPATASTDGDADGVPDLTDNCLIVANADQINTDGDAFGNACDPDDDNDLILDGDEAIRGTDPLKADTDGDAKDDKVDVCPTQNGAGPDGCVVPVPPAPQSGPATAPPDRTGPVTTVTSGTRTTLKAFLTGVRVGVACDESCAADVELITRPGGIRVASVGDLVLASRSLGQATAARTVVLKPRRALVGSGRRFTARVRVTTTDVSGNRTVTTRIIQIRER